MKQHFTFCMGQSRIVSKNEGGRESVNVMQSQWIIWCSKKLTTRNALLCSNDCDNIV
jgi:hypothetical protein